MADRGRPSLSPSGPCIPATVSLPPEEFDRFDRVARQSGKPLAAILRDALHEFPNEKLTSLGRGE